MHVEIEVSELRRKLRSLYIVSLLRTCVLMGLVNIAFCVHCLLCFMKIIFDPVLNIHLRTLELNEITHIRELSLLLSERYVF